MNLTDVLGTWRSPVRVRERSWRALMQTRSHVLQLAGKGASRESADPRRMTFVQFGDYAEGYHRVTSGEGANYYAQKYTVEHMGSLAARDDVASVHVLTFATDAAEERLDNGVVASGLQLYVEGHKARHDELIAAVAATDPTHLVVAAPLVPLIRWALGRGVTVLPLFADSFQGSGLRVLLRNRRLAFVLNHPGIEFVANHNLASSLDLARIGVDEAKIVPFDWPAIVTPADWPAKTLPGADRPLRLLYVGMIMETKGIGDAISAVAELRRRGRPTELTVIGSGDQPPFEDLARREGVSDSVHFIGRKPHAEVLEAMHGHDLVLIPSRHEYPEGLPMTIYEALCTRSPVVVSDHPMFALRIRHGVNAMVHRAGDPGSLADRVLEVLDTEGLYQRLSDDAVRVADGYLCPLKWDRLVSAFLDPTERAALERYTLKSSPAV